MDRRSMLKMGGLGLASIGMVSCAGSLLPIKAGDFRRVRRLKAVDEALKVGLDGLTRPGTK